MPLHVNAISGACQPVVFSKQAYERKKKARFGGLFPMGIMFWGVLSTFAIVVVR